MARTRDQFRQSDVTTWGVVALVCGGLALLTANISAVIPDSVFAALHATRLGGATVNEMHSELTNVEDEQSRMRASTSELVSRLDTSERDSTIVRQRIAALEVSVPKLTEALNTRKPTPGIDPSLVTGSIDAPAQSFGRPASAAAPAVRANAAAPTSTVVQPMPALLPSSAGPVAGTGPTAWANPAVTTLASLAARPAAAPRPDVIAEGAIAPAATVASAPTLASAPAAIDMPLPRPLPKPLAAAPTAVASTPAVPSPALAQADVRAIGIAVGGAVQPDSAFAAWQVLAAKVGVMLVGTSPLLAENPAGGGGKVLVAGPLADVPSAAKLCASILQAGVACTPMPYVGSPVLPAGSAQ